MTTLTDNALLEIFVFCQNNCAAASVTYHTAWKWHSLAHVCRRWRQIIITSPHRLDLQILCTQKTPVRKSLGIWPPFPIAIERPYSGTRIEHDEEDNVIAALEHANRVRSLLLDMTCFQLGRMISVMQSPFPMLKRLFIFLKGSDSPLLPGVPADFLGGSAPCLQNIYFDSFPFPALPTLLLSATDLVTVRLYNIPASGYFSPEAMVASLAALPMLQDLLIRFKFANTQPDLTHPPPPITRVVLPALTSFDFRGANEYLEVLVAPLDGAQLSRILIDYLDLDLDFSVAQFSKFFDRSVSPDIISFSLAEVRFDFDTVIFAMHHRDLQRPSTHLLCKGFDWQVPQMAQVFSQFSAILSTVAHLKLEVNHSYHHPEVEGTGAEWLHFFNQFSTVQALYVSWQLARYIAHALESITGEMVAEAWSSIDLIFLEGQPTSFLDKFITARQLFGRPVTVIHTEEEFDQRVMSYIRSS